MKIWLTTLRPALAATLVLTFVCGVLYPAAVFGVAQWLFPTAANGSLIRDRQGVVRGSRLLGQPFVGEGFFHPRPSAAGSGYDAMRSGGSNLGPISRKLQEEIRRRVAVYRQQNQVPEHEPIPADAVTASGSGLDPHISVRNAELQSARVARVRHLDPVQVRQLIQAHTTSATFDLLGAPAVNVLELNWALEALSQP